MKIQTSLEFLIMAGAIGALVVGTVAQYGTLFSHAKQIPSASFNYSINANETYFQKPYVEIGIPSSSYAGRENGMQIMVYGCRNGTADISLSSNTVAFSPSAINSSFSSMQVWDGSFNPSNGTNNINAKYDVGCEGRQYSGSEELSTSTYASATTSYPGAYSAYISGRNESIAYPLGNESVLLLGVSVQCTYRTWTGHPMSMQQQCGSGTWGYMVNSQHCMSHGDPTMTICIAPYPSGDYLGTPSEYDSNYTYSANLSITGQYNFFSSLSSSSSNSPVLYSGKDVGVAHVSNVSSQSAMPGIVVLSGRSSGYINSTIAAQYQQARDNLYSELGYYNGTLLAVDSSVVNQSIVAYENAESKLIASATNTTAYPCYANGGALHCKPQSPFYYTINANISGGYISNQTLSYSGSAILVNN